MYSWNTLLVLTILHGFYTARILRVLAGAVLTAIIQSSSASVGILQALRSAKVDCSHFGELLNEYTEKYILS